MAFQKGHALVIGVGQYAHAPRANVLIAATDAKAVADVLVDPRTCGYPPEQVKLLRDDQATKAGTLAALDDLASRAGEGDTVFIFYCGHGAPGEDGNYYFVSHDARIRGGRVVAGTGVSEAELIEKLRAIQARRVLVTLNTCYSGSVSPDSFSAEEEEVETAAPPPDTTSAILATGTGRIIITASGESQKSYIGRGTQSIFTQALTDGLQGRGVSNRGGYISAYNLYEHIYDTVTEASEEQVKVKQEPELTVLKGVGPFAVSLFRGASALGDFDENAPAPELPAVRQVRAEKAERLMNNIRINSPDTTISDVHTGGGAFIGGSVNTNGGDFVGRDKITYGSEVHGNNNIVTGDITGSSGINIGHGAQSTYMSTQGLSPADLVALKSLFAPLYSASTTVAPQNIGQAVQAVTQLENEVKKGRAADDGRMSRLIDSLVSLVPGAVSAVVSAFGSPLLAGIAGPTTQAILDRIRRQDR